MITGADRAFPYSFDHPEYGLSVHSGLSIREYFAAMAMQGFIASCDWSISRANAEHQEATASLAVNYADTLIAELNK